MRLPFLCFCLILLGGCIAVPKTDLLSPSVGGDATVGVKTDTTTSAPEGIAGGTVGKIGGDGDSVALWLAILALGMTAVSYPVSRAIRLYCKRSSNS